MSPSEIIQIAAGLIAVAAVVFVCVLHEIGAVAHRPL